MKINYAIIGISIICILLSLVLQTIDTQERRVLQFMNNIENLDLSGYGLPEKETKNLPPTVNTTYGEIDPQAFSDLLKKYPPTNNDVFYDLGSGTGKICLQVYLQTPSKKVVGVEYSTTRYNKSIQLLNRITVPHVPQKQLKFKNQDISNVDISDGTYMIMTSTCYPQELLNAIEKKLINLKHRCLIVTFSRFLKLEEAKNVEPTKSTIKTSWSENSPIFIYQI